MSRRKDIAWKYGTVVVDGGRKRIRCNFCNQVVPLGGLSMLKIHLAKSSPRQRQNCTMAPRYVHLLMLTLVVQIEDKIFEKWHGNPNKPMYDPCFVADDINKVKPGSFAYVHKLEDRECLFYLRHKGECTPVQNLHIINYPMNLYLTKLDRIYELGEYFYAYLVHLGAGKFRRNDIFGGVWKLLGKTQQILDDENQIRGFKTRYTYKNDGLEHYYTMEVWSLPEEEGLSPKQKNDTTLVFCHLLRDGIPRTYAIFEQGEARVDDPGVQVVLSDEEQRIKDAGVLAAAAAARAAEAEAKLSGCGAESHAARPTPNIDGNGRGYMNLSNAAGI